MSVFLFCKGLTSSILIL